MTSKEAVDLRPIWLLLATFLVAVSSLIYELIAATLSSYLLGDSIRQFSFVIGVFLSTMGLGVWLSRMVNTALLGFVWGQIAIGLVGSALAPTLFFAYAYLGDIAVLLYGMLGLIGLLSGMEIPLIARVLKAIGAPSFRFENVLSADYIGALVASLAFPVFIIPHFSLTSASIIFGCLNLMVAGGSIWAFRDRLPKVIWGVWGAAFALSLIALINAERMVSVIDAAMFEDDIVINETTPYQNITVTRFRERTRLFLNHSIQFDTLDEHRYHESLVHPAMATAPRRNNVLILGGGDGMAARETLKYPDVEAITLVDLDPRVTELFRDHDDLRELNAQALRDPRVTIIADDAWQFAENSRDIFDVIIIDLPDPKSIALSRLYSVEFYAILMERLSPHGVMVTQAGSPVFARDAFWSIVETLEITRNPAARTGLSVTPYHSYTPSFGDWGFIMARPFAPAPRDISFPGDLKYINEETWRSAQIFAPDADRTDVEANSIKSHHLVTYYQQGWDHWFR